MKVQPLCLFLNCDIACEFLVQLSVAKKEERKRVYCCAFCANKKNLTLNSVLVFSQLNQWKKALDCGFIWTLQCVWEDIFTVLIFTFFKNTLTVTARHVKMLRRSCREGGYSEEVECITISYLHMSLSKCACPHAWPSFKTVKTHSAAQHSVFALVVQLQCSIRGNIFQECLLPSWWWWSWVSSPSLTTLQHTLYFSTWNSSHALDVLLLSTGLCCCSPASCKWPVLFHCI